MFLCWICDGYPIFPAVSREYSEYGTSKFTYMECPHHWFPMSPACYCMLFVSFDVHLCYLILLYFSMRKIWQATKDCNYSFSKTNVETTNMKSYTFSELYWYRCTDPKTWTSQNRKIVHKTVLIENQNFRPNSLPPSSRGIGRWGHIWYRV